MRVALVSHELAPFRRGGVASHTAALARALAQAGVEVEVFTLRPLPGLAPLAQRREERAAGDEPFAVTHVDAAPAGRDTPDGEARVAQAFGAFLDRERPDVVHFEHLAGLGPAAVHEAKRRGIPTVFVAHDWWAAHDEAHLLLPDLSTFEPGDLEAEARGRLALRWLEGLAGPERARLGELHGAVLRDQLGAETAARLEGFLHGHAPQRAGVRGGRSEVPQLDAELELLRARQAAKRAALSEIDARFASSRCLARRLSALVGRAFSFRAPGVDRERIRAASGQPRVRGEGERAPLRVGFLGRVAKDRGLHVLLEACEGLGDQVQLHVHGDSTDRAYVARCRRRVEALGGRWHGAYAPDELPGRLAELDVVALPSLWSDSAPLVLREAYAAGLPVVASDTEPLRESVLTGPEEAAEQRVALGLLVPPGDAGKLREALARLATDDALYARLAAAAARVDGPLAKRLAQEAGEWLATYAQLHGAVLKRRTPLSVPAHLAGLAADHARLEGLPMRALFREVTDGLERLGRAVGLEVGATELMALAVGRGSRTRDERAADARAIEWLRTSVRELGEARSALEARSKWREQQLTDLVARVESLDGLARQRERELADLRAERDDHGAARETLEEERAELRRDIEARERRQSQLVAQLDEARGALRALVEERDWLRDTLDRGTEELRWLRERIAGDVEDALTDREAIEMRFERLSSEHERLERHERWLRDEVAEMLALVGEDPAALAPGRKGVEELERAVDGARERFARIVDELRWRRSEMDAARAAAAGLVTRIAGGGLALRVRSWVAAPEGTLPRRAPAPFEPPPLAGPTERGRTADVVVKPAARPVADPRAEAAKALTADQREE